MLPVFLDLKVIKLFTFGIFLLLAFFWGSYLLWKNFLLTSYKEEDIFDGMFVSLIGGLFLSRILYVAIHFQDFGFSILKFILINGYPGLSLYGFIMGFLLSLYLYASRRKMKFMELVDYFVPSSLLAIGFGKIGSFFSGPALAGKAPSFLLSLFPFYEAVLFFLGSFISYKILFSIRREKYQKGLNLFFFGWFFSLVTLIFTSIRLGKNAFLNLEFNTIISALFVLTFTFYFIYYFKSPISQTFMKIGKGARRHGKNTSKDSSQKTERET